MTRADPRLLERMRRRDETEADQPTETVVYPHLSPAARFHLRVTGGIFF